MKRSEILIDANIILRMLLDDIPSQTQKCREIFEQIEKNQWDGVVSILVDRCRLILHLLTSGY